MRKKKLRAKVQKESFREIKLYRLKKGSQMDEINVRTDKNLSLNFCRKEPDNIYLHLYFLFLFFVKLLKWTGRDIIMSSMF